VYAASSGFSNKTLIVKYSHILYNTVPPPGESQKRGYFINDNQSGPLHFIANIFKPPESLALLLGDEPNAVLSWTLLTLFA